MAKNAIQLLQDRLDVVGDQLKEQLVDPTMIKGILDLSLNLVMTKGAIGCGDGTKRVWEYSLLGYHLQYANRIKKYNFPLEFIEAVQKLTEPEFLKRTAQQAMRLPNPLICSWIFDEIRQWEAEAADEDDDTFATRRADILRCLMPMVPMIVQCPAAFQELPDEQDTNKVSEEEKLCLVWGLLVADLVLKLHNPSQAKKAPKRVSFVGQESAGKSTLINYLTSKGEGLPFMPVSEGMGTQMLCIVSDEAPERICIGDATLTGDVENKLMQEARKYNASYDQHAKALTYHPIVRAYKAFDATTPVDLIDVPGMGDGKFHLETKLAFTISSMIVFVTPGMKKLRQSLTAGDGELKGLQRIYKDLASPSPILVVVTKDTSVPPVSPEADYRELIKSHFSGAHVDVIFANFKAMEKAGMGLQEKGDLVKEIFDRMSTLMENHQTTPARDKPMPLSVQRESRGPSPYIPFLKAEADVKVVGDKIWDPLLLKVSPHFSAKFNDVLDQFKGKAKNAAQRLTHQEIINIMNKHPVDRVTKTLIDTMPVFCVLAGETVLTGIHDRFLIYQDVIMEVRMKIVKWLLDQGRALNGYVTECFNPVVNLVCPADPNNLAHIRESRVMELTCELFVRSIRGASEQGTEFSLILRKHFPWVIVGYYLLTVDHTIETGINEIFTLPEDVDPKHKELAAFETWRLQVRKLISGVDPAIWIKKCEHAAATQNVDRLKNFHHSVAQCIEEACSKYQQAIDELGLLHTKGSWNFCLQQLMHITANFVINLIVRKQVTNRNGQKVMESDASFAPFFRHLQEGGQDVAELEKSMDALNRSSSETMDVYRNALSTVESMSNMVTSASTWQNRIEALTKEVSVIRQHVSTLLTLEGIVKKAGSGAARVLLASYPDIDKVVPGPPPVGCDAELWEALDPDLKGQTHLMQGLQIARSRCNDLIICKPTTEKSAGAFASTVAEKVRDSAVSVVVMIRTTQADTYDPAGYERHILRALAKTSQVSDVFVLWWQNPSDPNRCDWPEPQFSSEWSSGVGPTRIHRHILADAKAVSDLASSFQLHQGEAPGRIRKAMDDTKQKISKIKMEIVAQARTFMQEKQQGATLEVKAARERLVDKMDEKQKDSFHQDLPLCDPVIFEYPNAATILEDPEWRQTAASGVSAAHRAAGINELQYRTKLFHDLCGQTIERASLLAGHAYDNFMLDLAGEIGSWFLMDSKGVLEEVERFRATRDAANRDAGEPDPDFLLSSFILKENFQQMYVGCVLWTVVPILHCTVLPTLEEMDQPTKVTSVLVETCKQQALKVIGTASSEAGAPRKAKQTSRGAKR